MTARTARTNCNEAMTGSVTWIPHGCRSRGADPAGPSPLLRGMVPTRGRSWVALTAEGTKVILVLRFRHLVVKRSTGMLLMSYGEGTNIVHILVQPELVLEPRFPAEAVPENQSDHRKQHCTSCCTSRNRPYICVTTTRRCMILRGCSGCNHVEGGLLDDYDRSIGQSARRFKRTRARGIDQRSRGRGRRGC